MPTRITPCRTQISDRFPVASFVVSVPTERYFEIACATDPALFHASRRQDRTTRNFHSSRRSGIMRAPAGEATYVLPGGQLRRFSGHQRIYYAIATYASPRGDDPRASTRFDRLDQTPYIRLALDFKGRGLDRTRLAGVVRDTATYGSGSADLSWGGDLIGNPEAGPSLAGYDDGHDPALWQGQSLEEAPDDGVPDYARSYTEVQAKPMLAQDVAELAYGNPEHAPGAAEDYPQGTDSAYGSAAVAGDPFGATSPAFHTPAPPIVQEPVVDDTYGGWDAAASWAPALETDEPNENDYELTDHSWETDDGYAEASPTSAVASLQALGAAQDPMGAHAFDPVAKSKILYALRGIDGAQDPFSQVTRSDAGVQWGLGFDQRSGSLGRVMQRCRIEDAVAFQQVFGAASDEFLAKTTDLNEEVRMDAVAGELLSSDRWMGLLTEAAGERSFRKAQLKEAVESEIDPQLRFAGRLGLHQDRVFASLIERCRQVGSETARAEFAEQICPVKAASVHCGDVETLDTALHHLGVGDEYGSLEGRLTVFNHANGVFEDTFTPQTQALLVQGLRESPCPQLPVPVTPADILNALQTYGSQGERLGRLLSSPYLDGTTVSLTGV